MKFLDENFLLAGETARQLYHEVAKGLPIIDYHCHLSPSEIASDKRFNTITEAWLGGDHYKWRLMRIKGIDENLITGDGDDFEKFYSYCSVIETAIGNPLYHWSHLEMKRYFDIDKPLTRKNARWIYDKSNEKLSDKKFSARNFIERSNVAEICTTDDPSDNLQYHAEILKNPINNCNVRPTFRPDRALYIGRPDFEAYMYLLAQAADFEINSLNDMMEALRRRIDYFHAHGCRLSDHDFARIPSYVANESEAAQTWSDRMNGKELSTQQIEGYMAYVLCELASSFCKKKWTMQLHCGAMRDNNTRMFKSLGKDTGFDTMSDFETAQSISRLLDAMDSKNVLPKTILYSLNPKDYYGMIALCGCFTEAGVVGKTQFGSAWWFIDHKEGMELQLRNTASLNLLSVFVGMLTDSRSFLSYPRHEYFRRIFCNLVGSWVDNGEFPKDMELLTEIVEGVCHKNAKTYFDF